MLGHPELDTEVSDAGIETIESDDCRGVSKRDGDANGVLAAMREEARFSCKDEWKFIDLFTQSISGLCWVSQLYPRTKEQEESSIEVQIHTITGGKCYGQVGNFGNGTV